MSQEEFEKIENYLTGKMSGEEKREFENVISNDVQLKENVENVKIEMLAVEEVSMREKLNTIHDQMNKSNHGKNKSSKFISFNRYFAIAASIAFLVAFGYLFQNNNSTNDKLYAEYFKPDPGLITPMSATHNYEFFRGMVDYKRGEYDLALIRWQKLLNEKPNNDSLNYFIGVGFLAQEKPDKALPYLDMVKNTKMSVFHKESVYFIGLTEVKKGNIERAIDLLEQSQHANSNEIVTKLKSL